MKIVFHGANAGTFADGFAERLEAAHEVRLLSDTLEGPGEAEALAGAEVVIGTRYSAALPRLSARLYHLPAAGYDGIAFDALPAGTTVCNCFGHEPPIAEYVMAALLSRHVPLADADARLRQGDWRYWAGSGPSALRTELGAQAIGIVGHGHIGSTVARYARAFGMAVHVANRSPVANPNYAGTYPLDRLNEMLGLVDYVLNTLPLTETTRSLIGAEALAAMRPHAVILNVGRGAVIDEDALYEALSRRRIGGAILDTWYVYPSPEAPVTAPGNRPFQDLDNVTLTPHMSGWTHGTIARRRDTLAENVNRLASGRDLVNIVRAGI